ncbi:MAG: H-X9-DG-CTERM domain-containing protein, partial [Planctomycetia bacterium]
SDPANQYKSPGPTMINGSNNLGIYAFHANAATFLFVDGSVRSLEASASADVVADLLTTRGDEAATLP